MHLPSFHVRTSGYKGSLGTWKIAPLHRRVSSESDSHTYESRFIVVCAPRVFIILIHFTFIRVYVYSLCRSENFDVAYFSAAKPYVV